MTLEELDKKIKERTSDTRIYSGLTPSSLLGIAFVVLKLTGVISWSWWWVLAPFWIPACIAIGFIVIMLIVLLILVLKGTKKEVLTSTKKSSSNTKKKSEDGGTTKRKNVKSSK